MALDKTKGSIHMQRKSRGVLLALVAVLAMSAVTAAAASATTPEFKPATKQAFTGTGGALTMENSTGTSLACSKYTSAGEITGASAVGGLVFTLTGCKAEKGVESCPLRSVGAKNSGEIVTDALKGELGTVSTKEASTGAGLLLEPASGKALATIEKNTCTYQGAIEGSVAAEVTPIKTSAKTLTLVFTGSAGKQKIKTITVKAGEREPELVYAGVFEISWNMTDALEFQSNALEVT
jgi:hypothetical protein